MKETKSQKEDKIVITSERPIQRVDEINDLNAIIYLDKIDNK